MTIAIDVSRTLGPTPLEDALLAPIRNAADAALGRLLIGWVPVAEAIEVFKQARVPDSKGYWELVQEPHSF